MCTPLTTYTVEVLGVNMTLLDDAANLGLNIRISTITMPVSNHISDYDHLSNLPKLVIPIDHVEVVVAVSLTVGELTDAGDLGTGHASPSVRSVVSLTKVQEVP
jgi:hypothetical protein